MRKKLLLGVAIVGLFSILFIVLKPHPAKGEGTYANIGTAAGSDGSSDAVSWAPAFPPMIDAYGNYISLVHHHTGASYNFAFSNDDGSTWAESTTLGHGIRASSVYDSQNDRIHVLLANDSYARYYRYVIERNKNYEITDIVIDPNLTPLTLDSIGSCTTFNSGNPLIHWKDNGANGILVAMWSMTKTCSGTTVTETRASMRVLSDTSADGTASNWAALDGTSDESGATGPAVVDYDKLYGYNGSYSHTYFQHSTFIRGGSGAKSDDIYYFNIDENETHGFIRLSWDSADSNWSGSWTSRVTFGGDVGNSNGYNLKNELMSKPVYDPDNDRVYIAIARWLNGTDGDTQSLYYVDSSDSVSLAGNVYSAGGTAWFAPTMDIMYNQDDNKLYYFFQTSSKDPNTGATNTALEGKGYYKTYDGSDFSSASSFFSPADYTVDIPIVYQSAYEGRILLFFRADGAETPYNPPHYIYFGYMSSGGSATTGTVTGSGGSYTATSFTDFDKECMQTTATEVTNVSGGEFALTSSFRDDFETPRSPYSGMFTGMWDSGVWSSGSYSPDPDGTLLIYGAGGAYIVGETAFNKKTLEFRAKFTAHHFQHIGWADGTGFNQFLMFSTSNNGQLNARSIDSGAGISQVDNLGTGYFDEYHTYKIEWGASTVTYYIDGVEVAAVNASSATNMKPIASNNTTTSGSDLTLDWINVVNYPTTSGTYRTCTIDSSVTGAVWGTLTYTSTTSASTTATVKSRTSTDNATWTSWSSDIASGEDITSTDGRYLQLQFSLGGTSTETSSVNNFSVAYATPAPTSTPTPTATNTPTPTTASSSGSSSQPSSQPSAPTCGSVAPGTPNLFQADVSQNQATLYFAPSSGDVDRYVFAYGYTSGDSRFGAEVMQGRSDGVLSYTIKELTPNTTYYVKVRGGNGCKPGEWSNEMKIVTAKRGATGGVRYYKDFVSRVLSIFPRTVTPAGSSSNTCEYQVKSGDSLWKIAQAVLGSGNKYSLLMQQNNLVSTVIRVGQILRTGC